MFIAGHGLFGRCDFVPGRFHVATQFFTIFFVPVIPLRGFIVTGETGQTFRGIPIPISPKSLLLAWFRAALWAPGCILLLVGLYHLYLLIADGRPPFVEALKYLGSGLLLLIATAVSTRLSMKASFRRAVQLGLVAGVDPAEIAAQYDESVPDVATLHELRRRLLSVTPDGKATLGPVGRALLFISGLVLVAWSGFAPLHEGYRGWGTSIAFAVPMAIGLLFVWGGLISLLQPAPAARRRWLAGMLTISMLAAAAGPWLSRWCGR